MAKNSIRDYSATNSSNTDIQSIDISEGCSPAGINNAIREVMADLKDVSTGAVALESPAMDSLTVDTTGIVYSGGNVGIGTASPNSYAGYTALTLDNATNGGIIDIERNGTLVGEIFTDDVNTFTLQAVGSKSVNFRTNGSERMRIDSSGNLLVGTASYDGSFYNDTTGSGFVVRSDGKIDTKVAGTVANMNRIGSDGDILYFAKNGVGVGSIGNTGTELYIGTPSGSDGYIRFQSQGLVPCTSTGANSDGTMQLGTASGRFSDLYLSGGVYLGGTGSANHLDDYEEGTWTPTVTQGTVSGANCVYRKIGSQVTVWGHVYSFSDRASGYVVQIGGLPFSVDASSDDVAVGSAMWRNSNVAGGTIYIDSTSKFQFYADTSSSSFAALTHSSFNSSDASVYLFATYVTG